jgi:hypothetical protein
MILNNSDVNKVWIHVRNQIRDHISYQIRNKVSYKIWYEVDDRISNRLITQLWNFVRN